MDGLRTKDYGVEALDKNGVMTLRGMAPSRGAGTAVETVAREVDGAASVIDETDAIVSGEQPGR